MAPEDLLPKLRSIRRRLRALLILDAAGRLTAVSIGVFGLLALLDWWVRFPAIVRFVLVTASVLYAAAWARRRLWKPAFGAVSLEQLALSLGRAEPAWRDRLVSAISFLHGGDDGAPELRRRVVQDAALPADPRTLTSALRLRRPVSALALSAVMIGLLAAAGALSPDSPRTAARRLATPFSDARWPKRVQIEPLTGDARAPAGEPFVVAMRLTRGDDSAVRAFVGWQPRDGAPRRELMRRGPDGVWSCTIEDARSDFVYSFEAGDDDTTDRPFNVRVSPRPSVAAARFIFTPPTYVRRHGPRLDELEDGYATTLHGSTGRLEITASEPVAATPGTGVAAWVAFSDGRRIDLRPTDDGCRALAAEFVADVTAHFTVCLINRHGFESREGPAYRLEVRPDEPPSVRITAPAGVVEVTPTATVAFAVHAEDDVGLESLRLRAGADTAGDLLDADLLAPREAADGSETDRIDARFDWNLTPARLQPGDVVECVAEAADGFRHGDERREPVRTPVVRLRIISPGQFQDLVREQLRGLAQQLVLLLDDLESARNRTRTVVSRRPTGESPDAADRANLEQLTDELRRAAAAARDAAARFDDVVARAGRNGADKTDAARQARRLGRLTGRLADGPLSEAAESLAGAAEAESAERRHASSSTSLRSQDTAVEALRALLSEFEYWSEFDDVVRRMQRLLDGQEALIRRTDTASGDEVKQPVDSNRLRDAESDRLADEQDRLARESTDLLRGMERYAARDAADAAAAEVLREARGQSERHAVTQRMQDAADALRAGKLHVARQPQRDAAAGLRAMLAALDDKPRRELAELSRRLHDRTEEIRRAIAAQQDLLNRTRTARDSDDPAKRLAGLVERQSTLAITVAAIAKRIDAVEDEGAEAVRALESAVADMHAAAGRLGAGEGVVAESHQDAALRAMADAVDALERLQTRTERLLAAQSLAEIVERLVDIRQRQSLIREQAAAVESRREQAGRLSRPDGLLLNRLARQQTSLLEPLKDVQRRMIRSTVYAFVCDRIARTMNLAADELAVHEAAAAVARQESVLRDLSRLIDAVEDAPLPDADKFTAGGGGGSAAQPTQAKPVPTLAELKVLRMLQSDLNDRTAALDAAAPDPLMRSEAELTAAGELGADQARIRELALKMLQAVAETGEQP